MAKRTKEEQLELNRQTQQRYRDRHKDCPVEKERLAKQRRKDYLKIRSDPELLEDWKKRNNKSKRKTYANKEKTPKFKAAEIAKSKKHRLEAPMSYLLSSVKSRAMKHGLPFNLDEEYVWSLPMDTCPILDVPLLKPWELQTKHHDQKMTLDKIVPELGYVKGNVAFISFKANLLKSCNTVETLKSIMKYVNDNTITS